MGDTFYTNGLNFSCKQCSGCCRHDPGYVYLSQSDLTNLCTKLNLSEQDFIKKYCRIVPYYDGTEVLCLQEKSNYDCIFWDNGCQVYTARPIQCSTYPFWTYLLESKERWNQEAESCPGINTGEKLNKSEICDRMNLYRNNQPLRLRGDNGMEGEEQ